MKCQIDGQKLRVRIDEDELARLLEGHPLQSVSRFANAFSITVVIEPVASEAAALSGDAAAWRIALPLTDLRHHAARLPSRDGLTYRLPGRADADMLELLFDVDVRDSARRRRKSTT